MGRVQYISWLLVHASARLSPEDSQRATKA